MRRTSAPVIARSTLFAVALAALGAMVANCNYMEIQDWPCPPSGTQLTYDNFGKDFLVKNCQWCHAGSERRGAPSDYDFSSVEAARKHKARIFARGAGPNATMPPGPDDPPAAERNKLAEWLACGAP
jgi:hypothetical protein